MPSPPQGYTVILPGEITQSDLDPQQPPAKLTSWPLTIGKDIPGPNESNYVANDNTGNILDIVNSDTSSMTLSALKMAIDEITIIRTNRELAINLANGNNWSANQSFSAGISFPTNPSNGRILDLTPIGTSAPYINGNFSFVYPNATPGASWAIIDYSGTTVLSVQTGGPGVVRTESSILDDGSGNMTVHSSVSTPNLNLNGTGYISALVSSFNGRTGAVVPATGDYSVGTTLPSANESNYVANDNTGNLLSIVNSDTSSTTLSAAKIAVDGTSLIDSSGELAINLANENSWSTAQSFTAGLATKSLNLNGAGSISALVSSFNGRTGAVTPASGDYSNTTIISTSTAAAYDADSSTQIGTIKTGPNGVVLWYGFCLTETPSSGGIGIHIGSSNAVLGMGPTSTGSTWSVGDDGVDYYPVIITGGTSSLNPNTSYDVYLINVTGSSITALVQNTVIIGL
jgi:hypothetical protein